MNPYDPTDYRDEMFDLLNKGPREMAKDAVFRVIEALDGHPVSEGIALATWDIVFQESTVAHGLFPYSVGDERMEMCQEDVSYLLEHWQLGQSTTHNKGEGNGNNDNPVVDPME